jgi:uncharacterized membrane protein (DUF373 family)
MTALPSWLSADRLNSALQRVILVSVQIFLLLVLLGLELLETVRTYFAEHRIRLEVIMIIAMIAVSRHIITIDFEHADGVWLTGVAEIQVTGE